MQGLLAHDYFKYIGQVFHFRKLEPWPIEYCIIAQLRLVERDIWIEGAVLSLSTTDAIFRPASNYILRRTKEPAVLELDFGDVGGLILTTDRFGYRIKFSESLAIDDVNEVQSRWRLQD